MVGCAHHGFRVFLKKSVIPLWHQPRFSNISHARGAATPYRPETTWGKR